MSSQKKTFVLGVGAQKSGTTWLSAYLQKSESYQHGFRKEYHVWDVLRIPSIRQEEKDWIERNRNNCDISDLRLRMLTNPSEYFEYFTALLNTNGKTIVADITPEYAGLNASDFQYIKSEFEKRGVHTKAVFLMRDPLERCWSNIRMNTKAILNKTGFPPKNDENTRLLQGIRNQNMQRNTRYNITIGELEKVFPVNDIYYGIFEEQFETQNVVHLSDYLGVDPEPQFASVKKNVTDKGSDIADSTMQSVIHEYQDVYQFCADRFPQVKKLWGGFNFL